jgi:hypothetical protein
MRLSSLIPAAWLLLVSGPAFGQEWAEYNSRQDFFSVNFPAEPTIRDITYTSEYGLTLPARVYSVEDATGTYLVTAIDYSTAEKLHTERAATCKAAGGDGDSCNNPGRADVRGAIIYASWSFIKRGSEVTHFALYNADLVEGIRLQLLNRDGSRTFAVIHMHDYRLYLVEGTVPKGLPPPALFQQSFGFLDKEGRRIRYATTYSHGYPVPTRTR